VGAVHWNDDIKQDSLMFGTPDGRLTPTSEEWWFCRNSSASFVKVGSGSFVKKH
jgi:hypothetical protein